VSPEHPSGQALLNREALVRRHGTGINAHDLVGLWCLRRVWSRGQASPSALASFGLRASGATLELQQHAAELRLVNAIRLGSLTLRFSGTAELVGRRPLLQFSFSDLELRWGEQRLWHRVLSMPAGRQRPFFALIARDPQGWLAARGRGGGLALWELV
jgi:hypothetical protein